jgi:hypothetical protein
MWDLHRYWIWGLLALMVGCVGCAAFGGDDRVCPEGLLKKVEYETDHNSDRVMKSITCYPKDGQRP